MNSFRPDSTTSLEKQSIRFITEQGRLLYQTIPISIVSNLILAIAVVYVLGAGDPTRMGWIWVAMIGVVLLPGNILYFFYRNADWKSKTQKKWRSFFRINLLFVGFIWGLMPILLFPQENLFLQVFIAFIAAGIASSAIVALAFDLVSMAFYALPVLIFLGLRFVFEGGVLHNTMSFMVGLFIVYIGLSAKRISETFNENLSLRIKAEIQDEALKKSEESYARSQAIAHIGSWDWEVETGKVTWSDETFRIFGKIPQSFQPSFDKYMEWSYWEDRDMMKTKLEEVLLHKDKTWNIQHRIVRDDGVIRIVNEIGKVYRNENGKPYLMSGTVMDITEQKLAEKALEENRTYLQTIIENEPESLILLNEKGNFVFVNPAGIAAIEAESLEDIRDRSIFPLVAEENQSDFEDMLISVFKGENKVLTFSLIGFKGSLRNLETHSVPLWDKENGKVKYALSVSRDITDKVRFEKELILAKEEAEKANRAKSHFLSSMSHELRTPMNAILGFSQLLGIDNSLGKEQRDFLREISNAGQHLLELINEILDLSKIESGQMSLNLEDLDPSMIILESVNLTSMQGSERGISVIYNNPYNDGIKIKVDRMKLKQILLNLLSNAIKYNKSGGYVRIQCESIDRFFRIEVEDNGIGISKEKQKEMFTLFNRLGADKTYVEGTGIGLVIVKRLVEMMGGSIGVESDEGIGSRFWIDLPLSLPEVI